MWIMLVLKLQGLVHTAPWLFRNCELQNRQKKEKRQKDHKWSVLGKPKWKWGRSFLSPYYGQWGVHQFSFVTYLMLNPLLDGPIKWLRYGQLKPHMWALTWRFLGPPTCHKISKYTAALEDFPWNRGQTLFFILDWRHSTPSDLQSNSSAASKTPGPSFDFRRHDNPILVVDHKDVLVVESSCRLPFLDPPKWLPAPPPPPPHTKPGWEPTRFG
jgi:hypothetical protein